MYWMLCINVVSYINRRTFPISFMKINMLNQICLIVQWVIYMKICHTIGMHFVGSGIHITLLALLKIWRHKTKKKKKKSTAAGVAKFWLTARKNGDRLTGHCRVFQAFPVCISLSKFRRYIDRGGPQIWVIIV